MAKLFLFRGRTLEELKRNRQVVFTYCDDAGNDACGRFPLNPNNSMGDIAAICDKSGRIMGMMPHPERALYSFNFPDFHSRNEAARRNRKEFNDTIDTNLQIFRNAVEFFR